MANNQFQMIQGRFLWLFAACALLLSSCGGGLPHDTPQALTESVFQSLVQNKVASIHGFLPDEGDMRETYDMAVKTLGEAKVGPYNAERSQAAVAEIKTKMEALWTEVRTAGEQEGIDWSTAQQKGTEERSNEFLEQAHARVAEIALTFESGGKEYVLLVGAAEYTRGWLLARVSLGK